MGNFDRHVRRRRSAASFIAFDPDRHSLEGGRHGRRREK